MGTKNNQDRELCVYIAEAGDSGVSEDVVRLITRCVQDKIFSASPDTLCVNRDDDSNSFEFLPVSWNILRKIDNTFRSPRKNDLKPDLVSLMCATLESIDIQAQEDEYARKKIFYFTDIISPLDTKGVADLATNIEEAQVLVSFIVPEQSKLTVIQEKHARTLKEAFQHLNTVSVTSRSDFNKVVVNTLSKPPKRASPWNVDLEIGPDLKLGVQFYIQSRKNTSSELKIAIPKDVLGFSPPADTATRGEDIESHSTDASEPKINSSSNSAGFILKSKAVEKETLWKQQDETIVNEADVIPAYFYGERIASFDVAEQELEYKSGDKCLKLLVFCPRENIWPCFMLGNGTDIVVANPKDPGADLKLDALVKALHKTKKVAIVRRVRNNNAKLAVGVLAPDISRMCLVYTQLCFADDVTIPHFTPLATENDMPSLTDGISEKDSAVDDLILSMSICDYALESGPVDPALQAMRDSITLSALGKPLKRVGTEDAKQDTLKDNIDVYFKDLLSASNAVENVRTMFPLKFNPIKSLERPSGEQIFLKREAEGVESETEAKKVKLESVTPQAELVPIEEPVDDENLSRVTQWCGLYAFDFDHTVLDGNSDEAITAVLNKPLPPDVKSVFDGTNWTEFMDRVMRYIGEQGIRPDAIVKCLHEMPFAPGMENLLHRIRVSREERHTRSHVLILSDANSFFIKTIFQHMHPEFIPNEIITNPAKLHDSHLKVEPYENQTECPFCPKNLCKGKAFESYVEAHGHFDKIYYTGDGKNDLCTGMRLRQDDILFVRKGYTLEKIINAGFAIHRVTRDQIPVVIKAKVVFYENGSDIEKVMQF